MYMNRESRNLRSGGNGVWFGRSNGVPVGGTSSDCRTGCEIAPLIALMDPIVDGSMGSILRALVVCLYATKVMITYQYHPALSVADIFIATEIGHLQDWIFKYKKSH